MRPFAVLLMLLGLVILPSLLYLNYRTSLNSEDPLLHPKEFDHATNLSFKNNAGSLSAHGAIIMPTLGNATLKAELGRSTWKLLHTMMARFPEEPTESEKDALRNYVYLFSRLYPCGQCAQEFQKILEKYPPQVSSREAASQWMCAIHNIVNKRLHKEQFDCGQIADKYKCGCSDDKNLDDSLISNS
ncbi:hypothetical protein G9A89_004394 [Geosiphon pyriformis]|nr:hypothetical protein G9A89_004394 [Geosiphon pyriformis]